MSLKELLSDTGVDEIEDDEWRARVENDTICAYCKDLRFELNEDDMAVIKERGYDIALDVWKMLYKTPTRRDFDLTRTELILA